MDETILEVVIDDHTIGYFELDKYAIIFLYREKHIECRYLNNSTDNYK